MNRIVKLVRESGGMGDVICMDACAEEIKYENPDTQIVAYVPDDFVNLISHCAAIDGVVGLGPVSILSKIRRMAGSPMNPVTHPYLAPVFEGAHGQIVDLYGPERAYEETCLGPLKFGRPSIFSMAAGCHSISHARQIWNVLPSEEKEAESFLTVNRIQTDRKLVGISPRGTAMERTYPPQPGYLPDLLEWMASKFDVLYFDCSRPMVKLPLRVYPVFTRPELFAAILAKCHALITVDSFPLHLAAALNVPAIGLFGPTQAESTTSTYPKASWIAGTSEKCKLPCHYSGRKGWIARKNPKSCANVGCERMLSLTAERIVPILEERLL